MNPCPNCGQTNAKPLDDFAGAAPWRTGLLDCNCGQIYPKGL